MWFIFMNSIKDLIGLTDIHCELLGDCVDNSRIIQLIGRKGYNIVAQLYALLLSKLFRYDFHTLCGTARVNSITAGISVDYLIRSHDVSGHKLLSILVKVFSVSIFDF